MAEEQLKGSAGLFFQERFQPLGLTLEGVANPIGQGRVGEVFRRLAEDYQAACCGLLPHYHKWLTYVGDPAARPVSAYPYR